MLLSSVTSGFSVERCWWLMSHIPTSRHCSRQCGQAQCGPCAEPWLQAQSKGVSVRAAGQRWDHQQLLLNLEGFKLKKKGHFSESREDILAVWLWIMQSFAGLE